MDSTGLSKVPAVTRAFAVLGHVAQHGPCSLAEVVDAVGANKSTVFYTLRTLTALDVLDYDDRTRLYRLGPALIELGSVAIDQHEELALVRRYLSGLLASPGLTLVMYRRVSLTEVTLLDKFEPQSSIRITLRPGERVPIQGGSFGRAFLAYDSDAVLDEVLDSGLHAFTPRSVTDVKVFRSELAQTRKRGWTVDHEGFALGVSAVAAPIFSADGAVRLVAAVVGFTSAMKVGNAVSDLGRALREACDRVGDVLASRDAYIHVDERGTA